MEKYPENSITSNNKKRPRNKSNEKDNIKMDVEENSESEYESVSSDSDGAIQNEGVSDDSDNYEEIKEDSNIEKKNNDKMTVTLWDEKNKKLNPNEQLDFDNNAYEMLHRSNVEWPCLTIDFIIPENLNKNDIKSFYLKNDKRKMTKDEYPYTTYMLAGSQTTEENSYLYYMKWYNMYQTKYDDDPEKGADEEDKEGENPYMKYEKIKVKGNINRLKSMKNSFISAFWTDLPSIEIVNISELIEDLEQQIALSAETEELEEYPTNNKKSYKKRKFAQPNITIKSFPKQKEGFGIDWSNQQPGIFAIGGQENKLEIYQSTDEQMSSFTLANGEDIMNPLKGHFASIEDVQFSPHQPYVIGTASVDKSLRFWDTRMSKKNPPIIVENAHDSDVNVLSWNHINDHLIASGGDDNRIKVWDTAMIGNGPVANIKWHTGPINCLMWDPFEESQLAAGSEDDRLSVWDLSVEPDEKTLYDNYNNEIPQQLMFLHQGQKNLKDLKFHPIFKDVICSTSENGINLFKPAFDDDSDVQDDDDVEMEG